MSRFLVCSGGPGRVVIASNGAAALAACGYSADTREAAVFDLASDLALATLRETLDHARALAEGNGDEEALTKVDDLAAVVGAAEAGNVGALRRCVFLHEEMLEAQHDEEEWP